MQDLDASLQTRYGSRLYIASGDPVEVLPQLWERFHVGVMSYEQDETNQEYATQRDKKIEALARDKGVRLHVVVSETLQPMAAYMQQVASNCSKSKKQIPPETAVPVTMTSFQKLFQQIQGGKVPLPLKIPEKLLPLPLNIPHELPLPPSKRSVIPKNDACLYQPPTHPTQLPWPRSLPKGQVTPIWSKDDCSKEILSRAIVKGGETLALEALKEKITKRPKYVKNFDKPKTSYTSLQPSTTTLSPYLSWGCISPRTVWYALQDVYEPSLPSLPPKKKTKTTFYPVTSLPGQMMWREFNNLMAHSAGPSWGKVEGNRYCRSTIDWNEIDQTQVKAWQEGRTGYPFIDACMTQLKEEGWIHHLGRHAVACFLTRGDLWQSWEVGQEHFESHLLDADYALNGFNWLWLSCSGFFYQYFRCYSPVAFAKSKDPNGLYVKKYVPMLRNLPAKYIYEPWKAPKAIQEAAGITIGVDYPMPMVDHTVVSKENMNRMKKAYEAHKQLQLLGNDESSSKGDQPSPEKKKQKLVK